MFFYYFQGADLIEIVILWYFQVLVCFLIDDDDDDDVYRLYQEPYLKKWTSNMSQFLIYSVDLTSHD